MGVIVPNPTITELDGSPAIKNVKTIKVSNGTLTGSGRTATIDTEGSGGAPAGSDGDYQKKNGAAFAAAIMSDDGTSIVKIDPGTSASGSIRVLGGKQLNFASTNNAGSADWQNVVVGGEGDSIGAIVQLQTGKALQVSSGKFHSSSGAVDAELGAYTSADTALPKVVCSAGTNGGITLRPKGTGSVTIITDGSTDPLLSMSSDTKSVQLIVDESQKLKVKGSSESFILDASSASGGLTFPDGTTQNSAATGGFTSKYVFDPTYGVMSTSSSRVTCTMYWPFFPGTKYHQNDATVTVDSTECRFYPWVSRKTGNLNEINVKVNSANASDKLNVVIYSTTAAGYPNALLGVAEFDMSSTGVKSVTSFTTNDGSTAATIALTQGEMYWVGYAVEAGATGSLSLNQTRGDSSTGSLGNNTQAQFDLNGGKFNPLGVWAGYASSTPAASATMAALWPSTWPAIGSVASFRGTNSITSGVAAWVGYSF